MAGHMIYFHFKNLNKYIIHNIVYRTKLTDDSIYCDVREYKKLENIIFKIKPDFVVNCVGSLIKESKVNPENTIYLNAFLPYQLMRCCEKIDAKLIHLSTDCVFSGKKGNYSEDDFRDADDIYGRSKALGEIINNNVCTLRTSIIGPELKADGEGLFHWFMLQKGKINGYTKVYWSGITTCELAKAIEKVIENNLFGLFHVTNGEPISKFDLLNLIKRVYNKNNVTIESFDQYNSNKTLQKSKRFDFNIPDYYHMLLEMKARMEEINKYPFYM